MLQNFLSVSSTAKGEGTLGVGRPLSPLHHSRQAPPMRSGVHRLLLLITLFSSGVYHLVLWAFLTPSRGPGRTQNSLGFLPL